MMNNYFEGTGNTPVTWGLFIFIILFFFFSTSQNIINCDNTGNFKQQILHTFIHVEPTHLLVNLFSLYNLRYLERSYGSFNYSILIIILILLTSWFQSLFAKWKLWPFPTCSIGFSAVLLGLYIFDQLNINEWKVGRSQLLYMFFLLITPILKNPKTSLTGHLSGILAGLFLGVLAGFTGIKI